MWGNYIAPNTGQQLKPELQQPNALQNQQQRPYNPNMPYPGYNPNIYQPNVNQPNQPQQINPQDNQKNLQMNAINPNTNNIGKQMPQMQQLQRTPQQYPNNYSNVPKQALIQQPNIPNNNPGFEIPQSGKNLKQQQMQINPQTGYPIPQQPFNQINPNMMNMIPQQINQPAQVIPPQINIQPPQQQQSKAIDQNNVSKMTVNSIQSKTDLMKQNNVQIYSSQNFITSTQQPQKSEDDYFQYILMYGFRSRKGFQAGNPGKVNQDSIVIATNLKQQTSQHYFGVCDGHGGSGHDVSGFLKENIPLLLNEINSQNNIKDQLFKSYARLGQKLTSQAKFDLNFSGSTCVGCFLSHNKIYCCNVGDSRAAIGKLSNGKWVAQALSQDQKPTQGTSQAMRILKAGGHIEPMKDYNNNPVGVPRVWLKGQNFPGLAMTRSFGDLIAAGVGVTNIPEIKQFTLTKQDKILVIGSDGLWQFLSNQNVIDIVAPYYEKKQFQQACSRLLEFTLNVWNNQHPDTIDDISFIVAFLDYDVDQL